MSHDRAKRTVEPFQIDADDIDFEREETQQLQRIELFSDSEIIEFLNFGSEPKRVLVGGKGLGKTLLLKKKSFLYRVNTDIPCLPQNSKLCDKIPMILPPVSTNYLPIISKIETWTAIWTCAISIVVMRVLKEKLSPSLSKLVSSRFPTSSLGDVVGQITSESKRINQSQEALISEARPFLIMLNSPIAIFIDNVDEALKHLVGFTFVNKQQDTGYPRTDLVWVNAQLGLLEAIRDLRHSSRIRIFATIRQEAYDQYPYQTRSQLEDMCAILSYSKEDVLKIFEQNISLLEGDELALPTHPIPMMKFLGRTNIAHWRAKEADGKPIVENLFDAFFRHTLGRPRDMMRFGKALLKARKNSKTIISDDEKLRKLGAELSSRIYEDYKAECVPYWDENYELLLSYVSNQILTKDQVQRISKKFEDDHPEQKHPFCFFWRKGLLGYIAKDVNHAPIQYFPPPGFEAKFIKSAFPDSPLYFFHPCLGSKLALTQTFNEYESRIIVGNGGVIPQDIYNDIAFDQMQFKLQICSGAPVFFWGDAKIDKLSTKFQAYTIFGFVAFFAFKENGKDSISVDNFMAGLCKLESQNLISKSSMRAMSYSSVEEFFKVKFTEAGYGPNSKFNGKFEALVDFNKEIEPIAYFKPIVKDVNGFHLNKITVSQIDVTAIYGLLA